MDKMFFSPISEKLSQTNRKTALPKHMLQNHAFHTFSPR